VAEKTVRLGLYLVQSRDEDQHADVVELVLADSAEAAAQSVAFAPNRPYRPVEEEGVGRLGTYDPGITGHRMLVNVIQRGSRNGALILEQVLKETPS